LALESIKAKNYKKREIALLQASKNGRYIILGLEKPLSQDEDYKIIYWSIYVIIYRWTILLTKAMNNILGPDVNITYKL